MRCIKYLLGDFGVDLVIEDFCDILFCEGKI